jgi:hypothetical protein
MTLNESIRDWIQFRIPDFESLEGLQILTMGEYEDQDPPFLGIMESGAEPFTQNGVQMDGVSTYSIECEFHTVPADEEQGGTTAEQERAMRRDLYDIIGDIEGAEIFCAERNGWRIFDIRTSGPTTAPSEGRRVTSWTVQIIACPI